jgi:ring-1,2-phenylacetyl-CoA epoxidase subunit PaaC
MNTPLLINQSTSQLINFTLQLADSNLILAQRNGEWCAHGPILEQDIAITNITLDLLGQARNFYQYAAVLMGGDATEDSLAYLRTEREYRNLLITELPKGDWAETIVRQFFYSVYSRLLYSRLLHCGDTQLSAIAEKSLKEVTYHVKWSSEWVVRLGDGTEESHQRMAKAIENLWPYTGEFFIPVDYEKDLIDAASLEADWLENVTAVFMEATLAIPVKTFMHTGGKQGIHTEHMGFILSDLQYLQRTYPGATW